jgi:exopolysaccharide biosynthesis polyprenyl glycosylphosphotransferase
MIYIKDIRPKTGILIKEINSNTGILQQTKDVRTMNLSIVWRWVFGIIHLILLVAIDTIMLYGSWMIAHKIGIKTLGSHATNIVIPLLIITIGTLAASGFYGTDDKLNRSANLFKALTSAQAATVVTAFFYYPELRLDSWPVFTTAWLLSFVFIGLARFLFDLLKVSFYKYFPIFKQAVVLIGYPADIEKIRKLLGRSQKFRIDDTIDISNLFTNDSLEQVIPLLRARKVSEVFICSPQIIDNQAVFFWNLKANGIHLRIVPTDLPFSQCSAETKMIKEVPSTRFKSLPTHWASFWFKRLSDMIASVLLLLILLPLLVAIAILIKKTSPGSIFYKQDRVGLKGQRFKVWKFRTMVANADKLQKELEAQNEVKGGVLFKIKADPRITKVGKFLRNYSLDEIPQLINVLQGKMSLVGPRPLAIRDYELSIQTGEQLTDDKLRYEVLPGITGLWQVRGRASIDSKEIFYWDMIYVHQWSLALDFKILLETIKVVLLREGSC